MDMASELVAAIKPTVCVWGFSFALMTAIELLTPRGKQPIGARAMGLVFWAIWLALSAVAHCLFRETWDAMGIPPLLVLPTGAAWAGPLAFVIAPVLAAVVYDFFFYWCHRAQHRWLWRYHAVHHAIRDLSAVNAYHHVTEPVFQILLIAVPMSLISNEAGPAMPMMLVLLQLQAAFIHSPSTFHLGPLRSLVVDNRFHRIHHSMEHRHFDHNFGAMTTIWDRLFGTMWMPAGDEWPDCGIAEVDQPRTLRDWVMFPADYSAAAGPADATPSPATARLI